MTSLNACFVSPDEARPQLWLPRRRSLLLWTPGRIVLAHTLPTTLPAKANHQHPAPKSWSLSHAAADIGSVLANTARPCSR